MDAALPLDRQFMVEAHSRAIDSCQDIDELRRVAKSLLRAWQLQAMFSARYGAEALGLQGP
jgi:hypothetical protein